MAEQKIQIADKSTLDNINESVAFKKNLVSEVLGYLDSNNNATMCPIVVYKDEIHIFCYDNDENNIHCKWNGSSFEKVSDAPYDSTTGGVAVVYNDEIHLIGGIGGATNHYKWDGTTWCSVSTIPGIGSGGVAIVYKDELYVLHVPTDEGSGIVYCNYKWNCSSWQKVGETSFEQITYILKAVVFNGEVHAFGWGGADSLYTIHLKSSDLVNWTTASTAPISTQGCGVVVHEGAIHMLGGEGKLTGSSGYTDGERIYHYKWDGVSWIELEELEDEFLDGSAVSLGDYIYLFKHSTLRRIGTENNIDKLLRRISELEEQIPTIQDIKSAVVASTSLTLKEFTRKSLSKGSYIDLSFSNIKKLKLTVQADSYYITMTNLVVDGASFTIEEQALKNSPFLVSNPFVGGSLSNSTIGATIEIPCNYSISFRLYLSSSSSNSTIQVNTATFY